mmetsp:Transcript_3978/g.4062  ORF Transcript_3978/g.4062 Transcript_3978/m.4062 type:complete len:302 (+) Transcript_3978:133-1038(+)
MNDRLAELKKGGSSEFHSIDITDETGQADNNQSKFLQDFFSDVDVVKKQIIVIRQATTRITDINQQVILATTAEQEQKLSLELGPIVQETNSKAAVSKALLQRLREDTEKIKSSNKSKQSEIRIRENLVNTLTRKFVDVIKEYQNAQQKYKTDIKKKVKRQVQIVKPDATTEEIDDVLKSGGGTSEVFKTAILKGEAADPIRNAYLNVVDKYQDVLTLEASVAELHQMFLDFALLTEKQGELLDQIEHQVKAAADYIEEGNENVVESIEISKSIRKKQCWVLMIFAVIAIIIIIISVVMTQ